MSEDQNRLEAAVASLVQGLTVLEDEIASLKNQPEAEALDFTSLEAVVARLKGDAPDVPAPSEPAPADPTPTPEPTPTPDPEPQPTNTDGSPTPEPTEPSTDADPADPDPEQTDSEPTTSQDSLQVTEDGTGIA